MSTVTTTIVPCPSLQSALNQWFQTCHLNQRPTTLVNFLLSPENTSGISQVVNPSRGKKRTVQLIYDQAIPTSEVTDVSSCDLTCTATTERGNLSEDYTIDCTDGVELSEKITLTDWMDSCRDNNELILSRLMSLMNTVASKVNNKTAGELNAVIGDWDTSVSSIGTINADGFLQLPTEVAGSDAPNPYSWQNLDLAKQLTQFCAPTFMVGGLDWYRYMRLVQSGCCADAGVDIRDLFNRFGQAVAFDYDVNSTFGADISILLQLRSAQLLTLNYAMNSTPIAGFDTIAAQNYYATTLIHPESGLPMDVVFSNSCGAISLVVRCTTKLVALPNDLYSAGSSMEGVNWIAAVKAVNS